MDEVHQCSKKGRTRNDNNKKFFYRKCISAIISKQYEDLKHFMKDYDFSETINEEV